MYRPTVRFTLGEAAAATPYQSKVGGKPYLPKKRRIPVSRREKSSVDLGGANQLCRSAAVAWVP